MCLMLLLLRLLLVVMSSCIAFDDISDFSKITRTHRVPVSRNLKGSIHLSSLAILHDLTSQGQTWRLTASFTRKLTRTDL
jgi:hypothetical protein